MEAKEDKYQPSCWEYVVRRCITALVAVCDTLLGISGYGNGMPNNEHCVSTFYSIASICISLVRRTERWNT